MPGCALFTSGSNQAENLHRLLRTQGGYRGLSLTPSQITDTGELMSNIRPTNTIRLLAAMLVIVAVIVLSTLATHAPAQTQSRLTLKNIRTDKVTTFYADQRTNGAWFVEAVLPTGHYADNRTSGAWFVEAVLPGGDNDVMTENLNSVAATL